MERKRGDLRRYCHPLYLGARWRPPFNPDITVYGISENEITARILEDLFDKLDIENGHGKGTHERSIYDGGIRIVYRCRVIQAQHFVGVGTYFLERG